MSNRSPAGTAALAADELQAWGQLQARFWTQLDQLRQAGVCPRPSVQPAPLGSWHASKKKGPGRGKLLTVIVELRPLHRPQGRPALKQPLVACGDIGRPLGQSQKTVLVHVHKAKKTCAEHVFFCGKPCLVFRASSNNVFSPHSFDAVCVD